MRNELIEIKERIETILEENNVKTELNLTEYKKIIKTKFFCNNLTNEEKEIYKKLYSKIKNRLEKINYVKKKDFDIEKKTSLLLGIYAMTIPFFLIPLLIFYGEAIASLLTFLSAFIVICLIFKYSCYLEKKAGIYIWKI